MALTTTTALFLAGTAVAAGTSVRQGNIAKEASALRQRQADSKSASERRNIVRQDRIRRAQIVNQAANSGTQGSSSEGSALGGIASQTATNISQSKQIQGLSGRISNAEQTSANVGTLGALGSATAGTSSIFL